MPKIDWKFLLMLIATLAGVFAAAWIWIIDHNKSMAVSVVSQLSLRPVGKDSLPEFDITVAGKALDSPYLTVIRIMNDGDLPILASDFTSAIELAAQNEISIVNARITSRSPPEIDTELRHTENLLTITPKLFNPQDAITVTAITSGGQPNFSVKARIVGIPNLSIRNNTKPQPNTPKLAILLLAVLLSAISVTAVNPLFKKETIYIGRKTAVVVALVSMMMMVTCLLLLQTELGVNMNGGISTIASWLVMMPLLALASPIVDYLNRPQKPTDTSAISAGAATNKLVTTVGQSPHLAEHLKTSSDLRNYIKAEEKRLPMLEFSLEAISNRFKDQVVDWQLEVDSITKISETSVRISASESSSIYTVDTGPVSLTENPDIRLISKGTIVRVIGQIACLPRTHCVELSMAKVSIVTSN